MDTAQSIIVSPFGRSPVKTARMGNEVSGYDHKAGVHIGHERADLGEHMHQVGKTLARRGISPITAA